jgi:hypothetical protein
MKFFSSLKQTAINFLEPYKTKEPATYAAAEQAIGAILITDGFIGIDNPFGRNKRPGIFGTIGGIVIGVIFMFIPTFFGNISGINNMTAVTSATVVSVGSADYTIDDNGGSSASCPLTVSYSVNGREYTNKSSISSSNYCSLSGGQTITINYNPANPGSWAYGAKTISNFLQIFFWVGLLALISSIITFFIRLFSIIFGWKLLKDGRKNVANLPSGTNLQTMIEEIKRNFTASIFGFGGTQPGYMPETPLSTQGPISPNGEK